MTRDAKELLRLAVEYARVRDLPLHRALEIVRRSAILAEIQLTMKVMSYSKLVQRIRRERALRQEMAEQHRMAGQRATSFSCAAAIAL